MGGGFACEMKRCTLPQCVRLVAHTYARTHTHTHTHTLSWETVNVCHGNSGSQQSMVHHHHGCDASGEEWGQDWRCEDYRRPMVCRWKRTAVEPRRQYYVCYCPPASTIFHGKHYRINISTAMITLFFTFIRKDALNWLKVTVKGIYNVTRDFYFT